MDGQFACTYIEYRIGLALLPGPLHFQLHEEHKGPGIFPHVRDIKGRKVVERT